MTRIHLKTKKQFRKNRRNRQDEDREVVHVTEDVTKSALAREKENDLETERDPVLVIVAKNLARVQHHGQSLPHQKKLNIKAMVSSKRETTLKRSSRRRQKNTSQNSRVNISRMVSPVFDRYSE